MDVVAHLNETSFLPQDLVENLEKSVEFVFDLKETNKMGKITNLPDMNF